MRIWTIGGLGVLLAAIALPLAGRALDANAATVDVSADDNFFAPSSLTVNVGDTVRWTNDGAIVHTVTSDASGLFDSSIMQVDDVFTHTFNTAGSFTYTCIVHSGMTGTITVQEPATSTATTAAGTATPTRTRTATPSPSATPSATGTVSGTVTPPPTVTPVTPPAPAPPAATPSRSGGSGPSIVAPNTGTGGGPGGGIGTVAAALAAAGIAMLGAGAMARRVRR